jgi:glycosyltransferase involved in cell wall biosynthesis
MNHRPAAVGSRSLRVLHVVHDYYPAIGGSELVFQKIGEGLVRRGLDVSVFTSTAGSTGDFIAADARMLPDGVVDVEGVRVRRFRYRRFPRLVRRGLDVASHVWSTRRWPGYGQLKAIWVGPYLPGMVRSAVRWRPDVIAATAAPFLPLYRAARAARRAGAPIAIMPCLHPADRWVMDNPALIDLLRRADGVMALTPYEMRFLRALDVPAERLFLIGGGVAPDAPMRARRGVRAEFGIPPGKPLVLFCGRKEEGKGIQDVLRAMVRLWQRDEPGALVLAGASTEYSRTDLDRIITTLPDGWRRRVVVRDDIREDEKWGWYTECDVLAHPSRVESFGLVYLEAWLCGKPVIGGRTGPQASLIDEGRDGLLVRPGDVEELATQLRRLLFEPGLSAALGRAGREKVFHSFTWDAVVDRAGAMYRQLAANHEHATRQRDHRHAQ